MVIRSKLLKVGDVEWGFELIHLWTSAQVLDSVNRGNVQGKQNEVKLKLGAGIASLRNAYGQGADETARDTALNGNRRARCALVSVGIDYRGVAELTSWATENKYLT